MKSCSRAREDDRHAVNGGAIIITPVVPVPVEIAHLSAGGNADDLLPGRQPLKGATDAEVAILDRLAAMMLAESSQQVLMAHRIRRPSKGL